MNIQLGKEYRDSKGRKIHIAIDRFQDKKATEDGKERFIGVYSTPNIAINWLYFNLAGECSYDSVCLVEEWKEPNVVSEGYINLYTVPNGYLLKTYGCGDIYSTKGSACAAADSQIGRRYIGTYKVENLTEVF